MMGKDTLEETDMRDGKVVSVDQTQPFASDGKTMHIDIRGQSPTVRTMKYDAMKQ